MELALGNIEDRRIALRDEPANVESGRMPKSHESMALRSLKVSSG